jgi:hypothetical protein
MLQETNIPAYFAELAGDEERRLMPWAPEKKSSQAKNLTTRIPDKSSAMTLTLSSLATIIFPLKLPIRSAINLLIGISKMVTATPARQDNPTWAQCYKTFLSVIY